MSAPALSPPRVCEHGMTDAVRTDIRQLFAPCRSGFSPRLIGFKLMGGRSLINYRLVGAARQGYCAPRARSRDSSDVRDAV